jgi:uncharacterized membrane protein YfcA
MAIILAVFLLLTGAYLLFGTERAFEPGSYRPSLAWCLTMAVLGLPPALLGGWLCARVAASAKAVIALAILVVVLGLLMAVPTLSSPQNTSPRPANVPNMEAMMKAQTPPWIAFLNPVIGVVGVMVGGRSRRAGVATPSPQAAA